eukprot:scaffold17391_cov54-Attheya_sp.AAC.3
MTDSVGVPRLSPLTTTGSLCAFLYRVLDTFTHSLPTGGQTVILIIERNTSKNYASTDITCVASLLRSSTASLLESRDDNDNEHTDRRMQPFFLVRELNVIAQ